MLQHSAVKQYQAISAHGGVTDASPHKIIELLLQGAVDRIAKAKGQMARGDVAAKGATIGQVICILDGLRLGLDLEKGGDIARNLQDLYDYMQRQLLEANLRNQPKYLDETAALLRQILEAWSAIGATHK